MREVGDQNHSKDGKGFHPGRDVLDLLALLLPLGRENKAPVTGEKPGPTTKPIDRQNGRRHRESRRSARSKRSRLGAKDDMGKRKRGHKGWHNK